MIIKLTGADFSANNIGKIEIEKEEIEKEELSQFTLDAIAASGNDTMTTPQQYALDAFFKTIGAIDNTGIYQKMEFLYLPVIAKGLEGAGYNYRNSALSLNLTSDKWDYIDKGIMPKESVAASALTISEPLSQDNISVCAALDLSKPISQTYLVKIGTTSPGRYTLGANNRGDGAGYNTIAIKDTGQSIISEKFIVDDNGFFGYSIKDDESFVYSNRDNDILDCGTPSYSASDMSSNKVYPFANLSGSILVGVPRRFLCISRALTRDEMILFKDAYNTLQSHFLTNL